MRIFNQSIGVSHGPRIRVTLQFSQSGSSYEHLIPPVFLVVLSWSIESLDWVRFRYLRFSQLVPVLRQDLLFSHLYPSTPVLPSSSMSSETVGLSKKYREGLHHSFRQLLDLELSIPLSVPGTGHQDRIRDLN